MFVFNFLFYLILNVFFITFMISCHHESLILGYLFITMILTVTLSQRVFDWTQSFKEGSDQNENEGEHSSTSASSSDGDQKSNLSDDIEWRLLIEFFIKFKNWVRFYFRYVYKNLFSFYKFVKKFIKYLKVWLRMVYRLMKRRSIKNQKKKLLARFYVLHQMRLDIHYKNEPLYFLVI
jgi:hypothetical protein